MGQPISTLFAQRLKALRKQRKMSQMQLAEKACCALTTISRIETAHISPSLDTLSRIAEALGVPMTELMNLQTVRPEGEIEEKLKEQMVSLVQEGDAELLGEVSVLIDTVVGYHKRRKK